MAQAPRPLTPHVSLRHYLGGELRYWREQAGLSQDGLGRLVHFSGDTISRVEKAERTPNPALIEACDRELGAGGALIRLLALAERRDAMPGQPRAPAPPTNASTVMNAEWKWIGPTLPVEHAGGHQSEALSRALTRREIAETTVQSLHDLVPTLLRHVSDPEAHSRPCDVRDDCAAVAIHDRPARRLDPHEAKLIVLRGVQVLVAGEHLERPEPQEEDGEDEQRDAAEYAHPQRQRWRQPVWLAYPRVGREKALGR